jgi:hypothetical protein
MFTKPLTTRQSIATLDTSKDTDSINRLLVAAAINPRFCAPPDTSALPRFGGKAPLPSCWMIGVHSPSSLLSSFPS